ncbi:MAG TPA: type II/IV secretion system protein [Gemmatimonadales bacterium]|jgi:type II secretory ATPase GspE/PulE/Tfp pilus assembly ATPase PilB-like protein
MQFVDEWLVPTLEPLLPEEAFKALRAAEGGPASLWETAVQRRLATDAQILAAIAGRFHFPVADMAALDPEVKAVIPEQLVRKFNVLPLKVTDAYLEVATANPFDLDAEKTLAFATGREVRLLLGSPARIRDKLDELYRGDDVVSRLLEGIGGDFDVKEVTDEEEAAVSAEEASRRPIIRLVDMMLADAVTSRASDIHVEPAEGGIVIRYRIDGVLRQVMKIPRSAGVPLISRVKIMSGLDIADRLRPQDGRARITVNGEPIDLRVSTLPASLGEKVVIRILSTKGAILTLDGLGMFPDEVQLIRSLLGYKEGILLVTGPTGSGKTTTLYSAIRVIQGEGVNIVTVEDPVEYRLGSNIVQVQVHEKAGLTFASALRSILRQDPDVVLIGEVRDQETAQIAVQASLTGHLVLSTLHTNDAANAVTRLLDMGIEAYKIGSALRGIIAQRLMRRLCPVCKEVSTEPVPVPMTRFIPAGTTVYRAVGCPECAMTGYRGRFSIVEVLVMTPELERLIGSGATADRVAELGRKNGMRSLWDSGLRHVREGETTIDELLRVTDVPLSPEAAGPPPPPRRGPRASGARAAPPPPAAAAPPPPAAPAFDLTIDMELLDEVPTEGGAGAADRGICVLLVDDEDDLRRVMRDLLEREGFAVQEARDGVQALDEVDRHAPDIIVLDLSLPGLDGYGVLSHLRSRPATRDIPVIVLTAKGDEENEVKVFEMGADDFLSKPFRARALAARLEAVLGRRSR